MRIMSPIELLLNVFSPSIETVNQIGTPFRFLMLVVCQSTFGIYKVNRLPTVRLLSSSTLQELQIAFLNDQFHKLVQLLHLAVYSPG